MAGYRLMSRIRGLFALIFRRLPSTSTNCSSSTHPSVAPDEAIARFVFHPGDVKASTQTLRYQRLLPNRNKVTSRLETSICRSGNLLPGEIWAVCRDYIDTPPTRLVIGAGVAQANIVFLESLQFDPNGIPFAQHADIIGWDDPPGIPDTEKKNLWMDKAQRMAPHFKYDPRPGSG